MKQAGDFFEVSLNQLEQMTGFTYRTIIKKLKEAGCNPLRREGRSYIYDCKSALKCILVGSKSDDSGLDINAEKARLIHEQWKKVRVERQRLESKLVDAQLLAEAFETLVFNFKDKMNSLPATLANRVYGSESKLEMELVAKDLVDSALNELYTDRSIIESVAE